MRIILILSFLLSALIAFTPIASVAQQGQKVAIIVNEEAISTNDVTERINMVISSSGLPNNDDIRQKLAPQVISNLVEEQIKLQEARRLNIEISETEIQSGFRTIAQQNNIPYEEFMKMINTASFSKSTMERQIRAQIAWTKVVQSEIRPKVTISQKDIDAALSRVKSSQGQNEFLVAEIYLPVESAAKEKETKALANKLHDEIMAQKTSFFKVAQQFSKAAGAVNGGDLGWVTADQLPGEILAALKDLEKDQISDVIRTTEGYHLMFLRGKRQISLENLPDRDQIMTSLGNARLEKLQQRHYLDLRSEAFIESRV